MNNMYDLGPFQLGDILWNKEDGIIISVGQQPEILSKDEHINVAFPIEITEEILQDVLGFKKESNGDYIYNYIRVEQNSTCPTYNYSSEGKPVKYINDIQQIARGRNTTIKLDLQKLKEIMLKKISL